jgi:uncharacterized protein with FMN-binding domain
MKTRTILIAAVAVILIFIAGISGTFIIITAQYNKGVKELTIQNVDASRLPDGMYSGAYRLLPVSASVRVKVANGKISSIDLRSHTHGKDHSGEKIIDKILEKQSLQVDAIAGSTGSSKVILKAVEKALMASK